MSDLTDRARSIARSAPLTAGDGVRAVARALQDPLVATLGPTVEGRLTAVDRRFAARTAESGIQAPGTVTRFVTPWPDVIGSLAAAWAMGFAAGIGRLTGGTDLNSLPVVAPTVIVSFAVALVLFATGTLFARRERAALLAQYEDSRAVQREAVLWTASGFAAVATGAMIIRLIVEAVSAMAVAATVVSGLTLVITLVVAVAARRLAKAGAAGGRLIHRPRRSTAGSQRNEAISASEDARDEAAAVIQDVDPETREAVAHAYRAAVAEVAARRVLPARTLKQLSPDDWLAARYAVDV
jgi:hypothetical protein